MLLLQILARFWLVAILLIQPIWMDLLCIYRPMMPLDTLQDPVSLLMVEYPGEASHGESPKP